MTQTANAQVSATAGLPTFSLPGAAGRVAAAVAASVQLPAELTALAALGVLSAATRGRWRVRLAPGWTESLALYTLGVAEPRGLVSPLGDLAAPIVQRDEELAEEFRTALVAANTARDLATRRLNAAMERATYGPGAERDQAFEEAIGLKRWLDAAGEPRQVWLHFGDATPEGLSALLARQDGVSAHFGDGDLLAAAADRHGVWARAGLDILLKAHDGSPLRIARSGKPTVHLAETFLALVMFAQPETVAEAVRNPGFHGRGLLARFLFAVPPVVGTCGLDAPEVPGEVTAEWDRTVRGILDTALAAETVTTLELTPDADEVLTAFRAGWEPRLHPETGDLAVITPWASKHPGRLARIAALLALAEEPTTTRVGVEHMRAAVNLAEAHLAGARAVLAGSEVAA